MILIFLFVWKTSTPIIITQKYFLKNIHIKTLLVVLYRILEMVAITSTNFSNFLPLPCKELGHMLSGKTPLVGRLLKFGDINILQMSTWNQAQFSVQMFPTQDQRKKGKCETLPQLFSKI